VQNEVCHGEAGRRALAKPGQYQKTLWSFRFELRPGKPLMGILSEGEQLSLNKPRMMRQMIHRTSAGLKEMAGVLRSRLRVVLKNRLTISWTLSSEL